MVVVVFARENRGGVAMRACPARDRVIIESQVRSILRGCRGGEALNVRASEIIKICDLRQDLLSATTVLALRVLRAC